MLFFLTLDRENKQSNIIFDIKVVIYMFDFKCAF